MNNDPSKAFTLDDSRQRKAEAPYTFWLPDEEQIAGLHEGDLAQLVFRSSSSDSKYNTERMWVLITQIAQGKFVGILDNEPKDIPGLEIGDQVTFENWHVISFVFKDEQKARELKTRQREYFDRCLVDDCVISGEAKVHFLYREEPDLAKDGDRDPDSGWRIRGDCRGVSEDELSDRSSKYVALGVVLNKDDSWLHLIDSPVGSAFIKDWHHDRFIEDV